MKINSAKTIEYPSFQARVKFKLTNAQKEEIIRRVNNPLNYTLEEVRQLKPGSLGRAYKVQLENLPAMAVKLYTKEDVFRNAKVESAALEKIPDYCKRTQKLVDTFPINNRDCMVSTFVYGTDLGKKFDNISPKLMDNILDELFQYEKSGMVFYDFSGANIKVKEDIPGFFDFECYKDQPLSKEAADAWKDSNHMSRNTLYPRITNISAFEIRTIGKVLGYLEREDVKNGKQRSDVLVNRYLKALSKFYERTANLYQHKIPKTNSNKKSIINYEQTLARLFREPEKDVVELEKRMMRLRELTTEKHFRNDPNLPHDDKLYDNPAEYQKNLKERFAEIESLINDMCQSDNPDKKIYAKQTNIYLQNMKKCWVK